jgi:hypothetical protein
MSATPPKPQFTPFWQVGVLVCDILASRAELTEALGLEWRDIQDFDIDGTLHPRGIVPEERHAGLQCLSVQGPPFLELIQGNPGSRFDPKGHSRIDHLAYWSDVAAASEHLEASGVVREIDGVPNFAFHRGSVSGLRIELLPEQYRARFEARHGYGSGAVVPAVSASS